MPALPVPLYYRNATVARITQQTNVTSNYDYLSDMHNIIIGVLGILMTLLVAWCFRSDRFRPDERFCGPEARPTPARSGGAETGSSSPMQICSMLMHVSSASGHSLTVEQVEVRLARHPSQEGAERWQIRAWAAVSQARSYAAIVTARR